MSRQTITLSASKDKLVLGGQISFEANTGTAALAQIDAASDQVDFVKSYSMATTIQAIATSHDSSQIVALAISESFGKAYLLVVESTTGDLMRAPIAVPMPTMAYRNDMDQLRSALLFAGAGSESIFIAFGHDNWDFGMEINFHNISDGDHIQIANIDNFLLSKSQQVSASLSLADGQVTRVYLGG
jgi:hypothetical protein